jgi:CheY-like chemotaxis protein
LPFVALVVDDSALIRNEIRRCLQARGYAVATAANGPDALASLESFRPELIVTALTMSKMNGGEFIREVRHRPETADVTIVAVAGRRRRGVSVPRSGADHLIFKEVDLVEQLRLVLDKVGLVPEPAAAKSKGPNAG